MIKRLISYFLQGLIFLVPIGLTGWLLIGTIVSVDRWARSQMHLGVPGLGVIITIAVIVVVGFLASNFVTRRAMAFLDNLFERMPVVKMLHGSVRDLLSAFVGKKRRFDKPVVVKLDKEGAVRSLGFVTRDSMDEYAQADSVAVYFPQAYNFAGQVLIVPRAAITPVDLPPSDVMTFIVSGGISGT